MAVTLIISSSNGTKIKAEDKFGPLPPLYLFWDKTSFHYKLKERNTKEAKDDGTEAETGIWDNVKARAMGEEFSSERHGIIFGSLRKRTTRRFNINVLNRFII